MHIPAQNQVGLPMENQEARLKCDGVMDLPSSIDVRPMEERKENAYAQMDCCVVAKEADDRVTNSCDKVSGRRLMVGS